MVGQGELEVEMMCDEDMKDVNDMTAEELDIEITSRKINGDVCYHDMRLGYWSEGHDGTNPERKWIPLPDYSEPSLAFQLLTEVTDSIYFRIGMQEFGIAGNVENKITYQHGHDLSEMIKRAWVDWKRHYHY